MNIISRPTLILW